MARKKTKKRAKGKKSPGAGTFLKQLPVKPIAIAVVAVCILSAAFFGIKYFFQSSGFFTIEEIVVNKDRGYSFTDGEQKLKRLYLGRDIFSVDLGQIKTLVRNDNPQLRKVEVRRILPNTLEVDIVSRSPVAVIDSAGGIVVDKEAVVLNIGDWEKGLVRVKGLSFFLNKPSRGQKIQSEILSKVLMLLQGLSRKMTDKDYKSIEYVDISDQRNIVIAIDGVTVKMGTDNFSRKIDKLNYILNDPDVVPKDIRYIDLRFEDTVISPK